MNMISFACFNALKKGMIIQSIQKGSKKYRILGGPCLSIIQGRRLKGVHVTCLSDPKQPDLFIHYKQMGYFNIVPSGIKKEEKS